MSKIFGFVALALLTMGCAASSEDPSRPNESSDATEADLTATR